MEGAEEIALLDSVLVRQVHYAGSSPAPTELKGTSGAVLFHTLPL